MKRGDQERFFQLLMAYADLLNRKISTDATEIWWRKLERFDLEAISRAFSKHTDRSRFFPTPSEILNLLKPQRERSPLLAWAEVERTISKHGAYATVQFDPVTNAVIQDMGGWPWMCRQDLDEPWTQREFERRYAEYQQHGVNSSTPLQGLVEQHNRLKGYHDHIPEPVLIGDGPVALPEPDRTQEVLSKLKQMVKRKEKPEGGETASRKAKPMPPAAALIDEEEVPV